MKLTIEQVKGIYRKFEDDNDGAVDFYEFLDRVKAFPCDDCVVIEKWCGMTIGIEIDGYSHT